MVFLLKVIGIVSLGSLLLSGCVFRAFEERNRQDARSERVRNQALAKAAIILDAVQEWSRQHGGALPNSSQFKTEVRPLLTGRKGADVSADEVEAAFDRFAWTFPGGTVSGAPSETEVGHLSEPNAEAIAYADGSVRRHRPISPPK